jgi:flagellar hook assembly protein FlgD
LTYALQAGGDVKITLFDVSGRVVRTLPSSGTSPGRHTVTWDSSSLPSGIYFYRFETGRITATRKIVLIR